MGSIISHMRARETHPLCCLAWSSDFRNFLHLKDLVLNMFGIGGLIAEVDRIYSFVN